MSKQTNRIDTLLLMFGVPTPARAPSLFETGPFLFQGTIEDNNDNQTDLTLASSIISPVLKNSLQATDDDSDLMLLVTGVRARFRAGTNTQAELAAAMNTSKIVWTQGNYVRTFDVAPRAESWTDSTFALDADEAALIERFATRPPIMEMRHNIDIPFVVSFRNDGFTFGPDEPANTAANVAVDLYFEGAAWKFGEQATVTDLNCSLTGRKIPNQVMSWMINSDIKGLNTIKRGGVLGRLAGGSKGRGIGTAGSDR